MIEIRTVRELLESELSNHGLHCKLTNQTFDKLGLQVSKRGYKTVLSITRYTHNPLEVEVNIDFAQAKQTDIIRKFRPNVGDTGMFSGQYRWLWLIIIFGGILVTLITTVVGLTFLLLEKVTPGWTNIERLFGIIGSTLFLGLIWILLAPRLQKRRIAGLKRFDQEVFEIVIDKLTQINADLKSTDILRCWSCFKQINPEDTVCIHCDTKQK
jgi:hypothetical protein